MNIHLSKSDLERLTDADKRTVINYINFLLWSDQPFDEAIVVFIECEYLYGHAPLASIWLLKLRFMASILCGVFGEIYLRGLTEAWLRIAGAYRCKYIANSGDNNTGKDPPI